MLFYGVFLGNKTKTNKLVISLKALYINGFGVGGAMRNRTADLNTASVKTTLLQQAFREVCHQTVTKLMFSGSSKKWIL